MLFHSESSERIYKEAIIEAGVSEPDALLAVDETRAATFGKRFVLLTISLAAITLSSAAFLYTRNNETNDFVTGVSACDPCSVDAVSVAV